MSKIGSDNTLANSRDSDTLEMIKEVLQDMKRMLNFRPSLALSCSGFSVAQPTVLLGRAFGLDRLVAAFVRFSSSFLTLVACIARYGNFVAMQLHYVGHRCQRCHKHKLSCIVLR